MAFSAVRSVFLSEEGEQSVSVKTFTLSGRQSMLLSRGDSLARKGELLEALKVYSEVFSDGFADETLLGHLVIALVKFQIEKIRNETMEPKEQRSSTLNGLDLGDKAGFFVCDLCSGFFVDPVTLWCGHTFCKLCIEEELNGRICKTCGLENKEESNSVDILLCNVIAKWLPSCYELGLLKNHAHKLVIEGNLEEGISKLSAILQNFPGDVNSLYWRADCFFTLGHPDLALRDMEIACAIRPDLARVHYRKSQIMKRLGNLEQYVVILLRCCALEPRNEKLRNELQKSLHRLFKLDLSNLTETIISPKLKLPSYPKCCSSEAEGTSVPAPVVVNNGSRNLHLNRNEDTDRLCCDVGEKNTPMDTQSSEISVNGTETEQLDDLECKLCFNLLFNPITSSCGHSFCRDCLYRSLDHRVECPCCRTALTQFLAERRQAVTHVLDRIIKEVFPKEYQKRKNLYTAEMEQFSLRASDCNGIEIPIFVCTLALPFVQCPLHIFEPRYRLMIRRCVESGSRLFGMCPQGDDPSKPFSTYGTMLKIKDVKYMQDGRSIISTVGTRRFCVQSYGLKDGYFVAKVNWVVDDPEEDAKEIAEIQRRHVNGFTMLQVWFNGLSEEQKKCVFEAIGGMPRCEEMSRIGNDGPMWLWWALAALPLKDKPKLIILAMTSVVERLRSIQRFLMLMIKVQRRHNEGK